MCLHFSCQDHFNHVAHQRVVRSGQKKLFRGKTKHFRHLPEFDILDVQCYGLNQRITMENSQDKNRMFIHLQHLSRANSVICDRVNLLFNTITDWVYCNRVNHVYGWTLLRDLSKNIYEPYRLQNIAAAAGINKLLTLKYCELMIVFNIVKEENILIRAGPNHERKVYNFANVVKHFIYKKKFEPLATLEYFHHIQMNPVPFCIHCGIFKKIEKSLCACALCHFLRYAGVFTSKIERPYHTK